MLHQLPLSKTVFHQKLKVGALCSHVPPCVGALQFAGLHPKSREPSDGDSCLLCRDAKGHHDDHKTCQKNCHFLHI